MSKLAAESNDRTGPGRKKTFGKIQLKKDVKVLGGGPN